MMAMTEVVLVVVVTMSVMLVAVLVWGGSGSGVGDDGGGGCKIGDGCGGNKGGSIVGNSGSGDNNDGGDIDGSGDGDVNVDDCDSDDGVSGDGGGCCNDIGGVCQTRFCFKNCISSSKQTNDHPKWVLMFLVILVFVL